MSNNNLRRPNSQLQHDTNTSQLPAGMKESRSYFGFRSSTSLGTNGRKPSNIASIRLISVTNRHRQYTQEKRPNKLSGPDSLLSGILHSHLRQGVGYQEFIISFLTSDLFCTMCIYILELLKKNTFRVFTTIFTSVISLLKLLLAYIGTAHGSFLL